MAQWTNLNQNNSFVNSQRLPLLCGISGAIHLALVDLTAGWLASWLADEIQVISKFAKYLNIRVFTLFTKGTALLQ